MITSSLDTNNNIDDIITKDKDIALFRNDDDNNDDDCNNSTTKKDSTSSSNHSIVIETCGSDSTVIRGNLTVTINNKGGTCEKSSSSTYSKSHSSIHQSNPNHNNNESGEPMKIDATHMFHDILINMERIDDGIKKCNEKKENIKNTSTTTVNVIEEEMKRRKRIRKKAEGGGRSTSSTTMMTTKTNKWFTIFK
mmetsp:Transcript_28503/g.32591  ORF Transcript_28503/g.32591 Transcript_28503/m.32591 type:complete len:194 (+) Transcript_28503:110-691(+)